MILTIWVISYCCVIISIRGAEILWCALQQPATWRNRVQQHNTRSRNQYCLSIAIKNNNFQVNTPEVIWVIRNRFRFKRLLLSLEVYRFTIDASDIVYVYDSYRVSTNTKAGQVNEFFNRVDLKNKELLNQPRENLYDRCCIRSKHIILIYINTSLLRKCSRWGYRDYCWEKLLRS